MKEWTREQNVISVNDDRDQVLQQLSQNICMGYVEEGRAHTCAAMVPGMLLQTGDSIPPGMSSPAPCCCRSKLFRKAQRELALQSTR